MLLGQPSRTPLFFVYLRSGWPGSCKSTRTSRFCGIRQPCWEQAVADDRRWFRYGWCCRCMRQAARPLCGGGGDRAGFAGGRTVPAPLSGFACTRHGKYFLRIASKLSTRCTQSLHRAFLTGPAGVGFSAGIGGGQVATEALSRGGDRYPMGVIPSGAAWAGYGCGEPRSAGHPGCIRRGVSNHTHMAPPTGG